MVAVAVAVAPRTSITENVKLAWPENPASAAYTSERPSEETRAEPDSGWVSTRLRATASPSGSVPVPSKGRRTSWPAATRPASARGVGGWLVSESRTVTTTFAVSAWVG